MSNIIPAFDPSASPNGGKFDTLLGAQVGGKVVLFSDSPYTIIVVTTSGNRYRIPASVGRRIDFDQDETCGSMTWSIESVLNVSAALSPQVYGESYEADEEIPETYPISLNRFVNVGNQSNVTTATAVINDNSAVPTTVVETTPSGQASSAFLVKNDGTFTVRSVSSGVWTTLISLTPGGPSTPASLVLHGTADNANNVPATGVTAGALPGGVTIGAAQLTAGTAPSGVALTKISSDGGAISSDGAGNLTFTGAVTVDNSGGTTKAAVFKGPAGADLYVITNNAGGSQLHVNFQVWNSSSLITPFGVGSGAPTLAFVDNSGNLSVHNTLLAISGSLFIVPQASGAASGLVLQAWSGSAVTTPFSVGGQFNGALAYIDNSGQLNASGTSIVASGIRNGNGQIFRVSSFFSGAATGTFSHGLGATPSFVGMTTTQANSTETVGVDTLGATTCHCNEPNAWPFVCMATF